jgi:hypothetical protein
VTVDSACPMALIRALRVRALALLSGTNAITGTTLTLDEQAQVFLPDSGQTAPKATRPATTRGWRRQLAFVNGWVLEIRGTR